MIYKVLLFVLSFVITYLFTCFSIPGMQLKLEAETLELFIKSIKHMFLFKSIISLFVGIIVVLFINITTKKRKEIKNNMISTRNNLILSEDYKEIKNKKINEQIILNIMNDSRSVFESKYEHNISESNGESDFYDINDNNKKYDAKILFYSEICKEMEKNNIDQWFGEIQKEMNEIFIYIKEGELEKIAKTRLYIEIQKRLDSIKEDENAVLLFPFPIGLESSQSIIGELLNSSLTYTASCVINDNTNYIKHGNFLIYGTIYNEIFIIDLNNNAREILSKNYISKYIKSETVSCQIL